MQTPEVLIGGQTSSQPAFGAYSASHGASFSRDIERKTPYALLEKTGQLPTNQAKAVFDKNNRWLRELGITSADKLDFEKAWETDNFRRRKTEHEWRDTYGGRLAIRTFSRGVLGSVFFATGQHLATKYLKSYTFSQENPELNSELGANVIARMARLVDITLGKGIYKAAYALNKSHGVEEAKKIANNVVTFRHTNYWNYKDINKNPIKGRSFGHEGIAITFDFGMASLGDYLGREIAGLIDPNTEKKWMKDGHVDMPAAAKALLKTLWTGTSKAMGEDYFAMAAGYPYVVRGTRNLIDKFSPGFKYDSDRWGNGGSFKVDDQGKIIGNYQLEGMTDLGMRFTAYNVYTKMFRDGYDKVASKLKQFWDGDRTIHMPHFDEPPTPTNLLKKAVDGVANSIKYVVRTSIKELIIMIPSSTVFAFIRSSQSKDIGLAINPEHGPIGIDRGDGLHSPMFINGKLKTTGGERVDVTSSIAAATTFKHYDGKAANFDAFIPKRNVYNRRLDFFGQKVNFLDPLTNPVGRFCYEGGHVLTEAVKPVARAFGAKDMGKISGHVQRYFDGAMAYTPYFMVKTDVLGYAYDTPRMDMSIDRMISGVGHLNFGEFRAGAGEVLHTILNKPMTDPDREKLAQKRMRTHADQLWSSQDEIMAKEKEEERQDRMEAMLSLGKPISMSELYRRPFTERVYSRRTIKNDNEAVNDPYYAQNITPMTQRKPEDYKKPEGEAYKKQANGSWYDRTVQDFKNNTSTQGQTIN